MPSASFRDSALPPRLLTLADHLTTGRSLKQIAREMGVTYDTLRGYTKPLYGHYGVHSRAAFVEAWNRESPSHQRTVEFKSSG